MGSIVQICYTHNNPSKAPLLIEPVALFPLEDDFLPERRHCSETSYAKAMKCKRAQAVIYWTLGGIFGVPLAFFLLVGIIWTITICCQEVSVRSGLSIQRQTCKWYRYMQAYQAGNRDIEIEAALEEANISLKAESKFASRSTAL